MKTTLLLIRLKVIYFYSSLFKAQFDLIDIFILVYSDFYCKNSPVEVQKANKNLDNQLKNESFDDIDNADASSHIISAEDSKFDKENVANIVSSAETLSFFSKTNSSWNKKLEDYNIIDDSSRVQNLSLNNEKISSSLENEDNQVILDFISNRRIDEPMLNSILIFFENQQASDGGEIVDFKLQNSKDLIDGSHKLSIRYKHVLNFEFIFLVKHKIKYNIIIFEGQLIR